MGLRQQKKNGVITQPAIDHSAHAHCWHCKSTVRVAKRTKEVICATVGTTALHRVIELGSGGNSTGCSSGGRKVGMDLQTRGGGWVGEQQWRLNTGAHPRRWHCKPKVRVAKLTEGVIGAGIGATGCTGQRSQSLAPVGDGRTSHQMAEERQPGGCHTHKEFI
jgi:hypothetical protein